MTSTQMLQGLFSHLDTSLNEDVDGLHNYQSSIWFWKEIVRRDLLRFLEFAIEPTLVHTAQTLLYAYTYSGTMEGLIRLCQGLFGDRSAIVIEDSTPAVINIEITNANINFLYSLASKDYTLAIEERFATATSDLAEVVSYDPFMFFRNFMTPGRVLENLSIKTEASDAHRHA